MRSVRTLIVACWRSLLHLTCSAYFPTALHGMRRPLCFFNGFGRLLFATAAWVLRPTGRGLFEIQPLEAAVPSPALVTRVNRVYALTSTLSKSVLSPVWGRAVSIYEGEPGKESLRTFRRTQVGDSGYMASGLISGNWKKALRLVLTYHRFATVANPLLLASVSEHAAGSIETVRYRGQLISYNLLRHAMFVSRIGRHVDLRQRLVILEIGGGYGGLARLLKQESPESVVVIVDIPPSLALAMYYLSEACPTASIADAGDLPPEGPLHPSDNDFMLLPDTYLNRLPDRSVDLVVNTTSFQEMPIEGIRTYFAEIQRVCRGVFYCCNRLQSPSAYGGARFSDYPFDDHWTPMHQGMNPEGLFEWVGRRHGKVSS